LAPVALSGAVAVGLLAVGLPRLTGTSWTTVVDRVLALSAPQVGVLSMVWIAGLFVHTYVMIVALPRLGHRRAMMLNFSGSAVANVVPFGGVLGMGLNYSMLRSWGFSRGEFTLMTVLTHIWTFAARLLLPSVAIGLLVVAGRGASRNLVITAIVGLVVIALVLVGMAAARGADAARRFGSLANRAFDRLVPSAAGESIADLRVQARTVVRIRWRQLTVGALGYALLQACLLGLCLHAFGTVLSPIDIFAGFAVGGLLALIPITPGGLGLSETGMAALLVALGGDPAATTAAVLLFRTFTFLLEIPVGAACTAAWWLRRPSPSHPAGPDSAVRELVATP
jgi:uncharacterized protein (TIRG00374 family)